MAGFTTDLGLKGYDFNAILSIFYISFILLEIPATIACKAIGPGWFIPATTLGFGVCSVCTGFVHTKQSAAGVRFVLGIFEAGMMPGIAYYLSRWYRRSELVFRLSLYIVMAPLAGAFGGLLSSGILMLPHFGGLHTWRMIFAIDGIITCGLAVISFFTLTDRPATARWLTEDEKSLAIARVKAERVGTTEVLDKIDIQKILRGFSPVTLSTAFIFILNNTTVQGLSFFSPTIVESIYPNRSVIFWQLRTVPPYVVGAFFTVLWPLLSWRYDRRLIFCIISPPLSIIGYIMFLSTSHPNVRYGALFLIAAGSFAYGALGNAIASANVISDTARTTAIGVNVLGANIGGLISTWTYLPTNAPSYDIGNGLNLACAAAILIIVSTLLIWMNYDNKKRAGKDVDSELAGLTQDQVQDLDWRNPAFRWRP